MWGEVQRAAGAMERLVELQSAQPTIIAPAQPVAFPAPARAASVSTNVSFRYPSRPETRALERFRWRSSPAKRSRSSGPSGAGKSTTFQLLLRFYDPRRAASCRRRRHRARRPAGPARRASASCRRTRCCSARAHARTSATAGPARATPKSKPPPARPGADFHRAAAEGLRHLPRRARHAALGRAATAHRDRARDLKDPPILLLDEATSSLDAESELLVQQALERSCRTARRSSSRIGSRRC